MNQTVLKRNGFVFFPISMYLPKLNINIANTLKIIHFIQRSLPGLLLTIEQVQILFSRNSNEIQFIQNFVSGEIAGRTKINICALTLYSESYH